jgi:integrase
MTEKTRLTKRTVDAIAAPAEGRVTYQDEDDAYLHLVVTPTVKTWRYIRKVRGRAVFLTLGRFPDMTPDQARKASQLTSAAYATGADPQQARRESRHVATWGDLFNWYMESHAKPHKRTWRGDQKQVDRYCKAWLARAWQTITPDCITRWHRHVGEEHGKFAADRALALVRTVFNKALKAELIRCERNPAVGVEMFHKTAESYSRDRFLQADELKRLFAVLNEYPNTDMADFFRLAVFTGARRSNVQAMRWQDFDRERQVWTIPSAASKNKVAMQIPLLPAAVEILNRRYEGRQSDEWVFPARRCDAKTPHLSEPKAAWKAICKKAQIEGVRVHDLRRTLGSWQALTGASLPIIGKALGHRSGRTTAIYARLTMDPVRESMEKAVTAMLNAGHGGAK